MKVHLHPIRKLLALAALILMLSGVGMAQECDGRRPSIQDYSAAEQLELRNLILQYLATGFDPSIPLTNAVRFANRNPIVGIHSAFANTQGNEQNWHSNNENFFSWHRGYIHGLETFLEETPGGQKFVPLPTYNPTDQIPGAFVGTASMIPDLLAFGLTGSFSFPNVDFNTFNGVDGFIQEVSECGSLTIDQFAGVNRINGHNNTHVLMGDAMSSVLTASGAAIFWLFHAYVDEAYYCFQSLCQQQTSDLWVSDSDQHTEEDTGAEPSPVDQPWKSRDIFPVGGWDHGSGTIQQNNGETVTIGVRVRNRGQLPNPEGTGRIRLYWAAASAGLSFPQSFDGSLEIPECPNRPLGGFIGVQDLRSINEPYTDVFDVDNDGSNSDVFQDHTIYEFEWLPPDPDNYRECFGDDWEHRHFCLLAIIEEGDNGTAPTQIGNSFTDFVRNNNVVALRNIALYGNGIVDGLVPPDECFLVGNYTDSGSQDMSVSINLSSENAQELFRLTNAQMSISDNLAKLWLRGGQEVTQKVTMAKEREEENRTYFKMNGAAGGLAGMHVPPGVIGEVCLSFELTPGALEEIKPYDSFEIDLEQYDGTRLVGGETIIVTAETLIKQQQQLEENRKKFSDRTGEQKSLGNIQSALKVFPNPSTGKFSVRLPSDESNYTLTLHNFYGQQVWTRQVEKSTIVEVATGATPPGAYLLHVLDETSGVTETVKVVIK